MRSGPNAAPGGRSQAAAARDAHGNLWLYGGDGYDDAGNRVALADLWEYRIDLGQWLFVAGATAGPVNADYGPGGHPGSRRLASAWVDANGDFWLFGGDGFDATGTDDMLADLWRYSPATGAWTFVGGPTGVGVPSDYARGVPGGRLGALALRDASGVFWLFGGYGVVAGGSHALLNDLWKLDPSTAPAHWTFVGGSQSGSAPGIYPRGGVAPYPGGRIGATGWADAQGNLWLFGGNGRGADAASEGPLNDLWKYSPTANGWNWVGGSSAVNAVPTYGQRGVPAGGTTPGGIADGGGDIDPGGNLWLFGGDGLDTQTSYHVLQDLWEYRTDLNVWVWMAGTGLPGTAPNYGTRGAPGATNLPSGRSGAVLWSDPVGNLRLFGGAGSDAAGPGGPLSDVWLYTTPP